MDFLSFFPEISGFILQTYRAMSLAPFFYPFPLDPLTCQTQNQLVCMLKSLYSIVLTCFARLISDVES